MNLTDRWKVSGLYFATNGKKFMVSIEDNYNQLKKSHLRAMRNV